MGDSFHVLEEQSVCYFPILYWRETKEKKNITVEASPVVLYYFNLEFVHIIISSLNITFLCLQFLKQINTRQIYKKYSKC